MENLMSRTIKVVTLFAFILFSISTMAQDDKSKRPSPPAKVSEKIGNTTVTIDYSQPAVKNRDIWDGLVPYGKVWRTGANEATTFEVSSDVKVEGNALKAGKYALFTIPAADEWTIIFNSVPDQWGAFNYDESKDVLRVKVKPEKADQNTERMTFEISDAGLVSLMWEKLNVSFKVQ
jgi:hypothetical protein